MHRKPDDSRSLRYKGREYKWHLTDERHTELLRFEEQASLIAFVQKHELDVRPHQGQWKTFVNLGKRPWGSAIIKYAKGKTWTAAVRKAKRVIEKGKK